MAFKSPENVCTVPFIEGIEPYKDTLFEKYLLNKPALYIRDDGEKIVVFHFVDYNSTEYFPIQVMLHPQAQFRGFYKVPNFKIFHFPKKENNKYFELVLKTFDPLSDVDKVEKFKKDLIKKGFLTEEVFHKYVEDRINYSRNIKDIETIIDFSLY